MSDLPRRFSLVKRSSGIYYIVYRKDGRQRWKSTKTTNKSEALRLLTDFKELLREKRPRIAMNEFVQRFLTYAQTHLSSNTIRLYKTIFKSFTAFVKDAYIDDVNAETLDRYKAQRLREVSRVSVNVELRMLKAAFGTARRWNLIEQNPFQNVSLVKVPEQAPLALSVEDFQKLLGCLSEQWLKEIVVFAVSTGMRRGEILNLRWCDVDLASRVVTIQTSERFKTKHGRRRVIPLNDAALYILMSRKGKSASEYVFTLNDKPISGGWVSHLFKRYVRKAKLQNPCYRFHSLRHTFATWLVQNGVGIYEVQKLLGHSSIAVTQQYSHLAPTELHSAVNKLTMNLN